MTDEPYPEVPREVLRPARPPEKRGAISARLRGGRHWVTAADCKAAAETIDALVEALGEARLYVPEHHGPVIHKINAALALARKGEG